MLEKVPPQLGKSRESALAIGKDPESSTHLSKPSLDLHFNVPRHVRGIQEICAKTLDPADKPQGVGRDVIKRQLIADAPRHPEIFLLWQSYCIRLDRPGSRGQAAGRRDRGYSRQKN